MARPRFALLAVALAAACADLTGAVGEKTGQLRFELRAQQQQQEEISVLERVVLVIEPASGRRQQHQHLLEPSQSVVSFPVRVREGTARFAAEVRSNNGTLLFSGDQSAEILADGFQVAVPLTRQHAPVLYLQPASLNTGSERAFFLINRATDQGVGSLDWSVAGITPQVSLCPALQIIPPCMFFSPPSGSLAPLSSQTVTIAQSGLVPGDYTVRLGSRVGHLDLVVTVPQ